MLPIDSSIQGVNDSKKIGEPERERLYEAITTCPGVIWAVAVLQHDEIDKLNILEVPSCSTCRLHFSLPERIGVILNEVQCPTSSDAPIAYDPSRQATMEAMRQCVNAVRAQLPDEANILIAVDGNRLPKGIDEGAKAEAVRAAGWTRLRACTVRVFPKATGDVIKNKWHMHPV
jgi:ribonuclease HII